MATVKPLFLRAQAVEADQRVDGAGDHDGVEAKKQAAQRAGQGGLHQVQVGSHGLLVLEFQIIVQIETCPSQNQDAGCTSQTHLES